MSLRLPSWPRTVALIASTVLAAITPYVDARGPIRPRPVNPMLQRMQMASPSMMNATSSMMPMRNQIMIPSLATQSINPIFRVTPTQTLPQAAFNTVVTGQALRQGMFGSSFSPGAFSTNGQMMSTNRMGMNSNMMMSNMTMSNSTPMRNQIMIPSLATQSINPIMRVSPTESLPQAAFNVAVAGQALRTLPGFGFDGHMPFRPVSLFATNTTMPNMMMSNMSSMSSMTPTMSSMSSMTPTRSQIMIPSLATQSINPIMRVTPTQTLPQLAFDVSVAGQALRHVPRSEFGLSPYGGFGLAGAGFGASPYAMSGYGGYGGGYSPPMSGGFAEDTMPGFSTVPMTMPAQLTASGQTNGYYPAVADSNQVSDARVSAPETQSLLVTNTTPERPESTRDVWIYDDMFSPSTLWVTAGTTVRWINYGYRPHSIVSQQGLWDSGSIHHGSKFSITFNEPGTYRYVSRDNPSSLRATVIVAR